MVPELDEKLFTLPKTVRLCVAHGESGFQAVSSEAVKTQSREPWSIGATIKLILEANDAVLAITKTPLQPTVERRQPLTNFFDCREMET
jgi:hypothetical protein